MYTPIVAPGTALLETLTMDPVMDSATAAHCDACGETVTPDGRCLNVAVCHAAHSAASALSRGEGIKSRRAPMAFNIRGAID